MSPTDNMMSPCSQKIEQKRKHLLQTIKPKSLTDKFSAVAAEEKKSPLAATSGEDTLPPGSPMKM
ncbi:hypothetical protein HK102_000254 [Quaeritorhiza haematococci]|nr:hypothetical protein HK102_000254 [Quaeritorhiza haematococci]